MTIERDTSGLSLKPEVSLAHLIHEVKSMWSDWLSFYDWDYFVTLTYAKTCYLPATALAKAKRWSKQYYFQRAIFFVENFHWSDGVHLHGLVKMNEGLKLQASELWQSWFDKYGICRILPYIAGKGAEHYLTKYISKDVKRNDYLIWGRKKWWKNGLELLKQNENEINEKKIPKSLDIFDKTGDNSITKDIRTLATG